MTPKTQPLPSILHCCSCLATLSLFAAVLLAANDEVEASPTGFASCSQREALASLSSAVARSEPTEPLVRKRRQFLSCWGGWAPSCTGGTLWAELRSYRNQLRPRPVPRVEERHKTGGGGARRTSGRRTDGIPSIVTSGGWEPGAMGKRSQIPDARLTQPFGDLLKWNQLLDGGV